MCRTKALLLPVLVVALLLPGIANAARCWVTLEKIGDGLSLQTARHPALGDLKGKYTRLVVGYEGTDEELVLIVVDSANVPALKTVASRFHGQEIHKGGKRVMTKNLKAKIVAEAVRLGAPADFDPEKVDVSGE